MLDLEKLRESERWTRQQIADKTGIDYSLIYRYDKKTVMPSYENVVKILDAMDFEFKLVRKRRK